MSSPRVCVVVPFRDAARTLPAAVASLRAQTLEDWRAVFVDDGSTDDGPAALAGAPRLQLLRPPARGLIPALNAGVAAARATGAPYLARFDADDVCRPDRFARQVAHLDAHPVDVVDSRWDPITDGPPSEGLLRYRRWHDTVATHDHLLRELLVESPVCHPAVMMRAASLPAGPLYRDFDGPEDYDLWLRLVRRGLRFHKLPERLLGWRDHPGRTSRTDDRYRRDAFFALKWAHFVATCEARRVAVWGARRGGRPWIRALADAGRLAGVVDIDPRLVGGSRHGTPVVAPEDLPSLDADLVLLAVGAAGARAAIAARTRGSRAPTLAVAGTAG